MYVLCCLFHCFFFFKQKTAYEMRISDWSSDVCSSDLDGIGAEVPMDQVTGTDPLVEEAEGNMIPTVRIAKPVGWPDGAVPAAAEDRKSVVEGKSVSVRVDLGGRRIIKKKNTK